MANHYGQISLPGRRILYRLLLTRCPIAEIRRNFHYDTERDFAGYFPVTAQAWREIGVDVSRSSCSIRTCASL